MKHLFIAITLFTAAGACQTSKKDEAKADAKLIDEANPSGESKIRNNEALKPADKPAVDPVPPPKQAIKRKHPVKK